MARQRRSILQIVVLACIALGLWALFPYVAVFLEAAALNIRRFWWAILLIILASWIAWVFSKRNPG